MKGAEARRAKREPAPPPEAAGSRPEAPLVYVESSALVAAFLEDDRAARKAIRSSGRRFTSSLTLTEALRAVIRARVTGRVESADERRVVRGLRRFARRCDVIGITDDVLSRAGRPFPREPIRTLDAIHLASVEVLGEPPPLVTVVTRDVRVADNARALGYAVAP